MCIAFWTLQHPAYALILCTNRDEFLDRPTTNAQFHSFHPENESESKTHTVLSGVDDLCGGTWFGVNRAGRVALLTNITEPKASYGSSRGYLVSSFLLSTSSRPLEDEVGKIVPRDAKYAGFNLLLLSPESESPSEPLGYRNLFVTNGGGGHDLTSRALTAVETVCGCFSNGIDDKGGKEWPKVKHGTKDFSSVLDHLPSDVGEDELIEKLFGVLSWESPDPVTERAHLRRTVHVAPVKVTEGAPDGRPSWYGTRLSTVLLISRDRQAVFVERDIWKVNPTDGSVFKADPSSQRIFRFNVEA